MTDISENDIQVVRKWLDGGCPSWGVPVDQIRKLCSALAAIEDELAALRESREQEAVACATDGCDNPATNQFVRGDVGSMYCGECFAKVVEVCDKPAPQTDASGVREALTAKDVLGIFKQLPEGELSGNTGELVDRVAAAIRDWGSHFDDGPSWESLSDERKEGWRSDARRALAAIKDYLTSAPVVPAPEAQHTDDKAVDRFAAAMKRKLAQKREEGRGGWDDPEQCSAQYLSNLLRDHVEKGDPLDVGNLAMMLHQRGERISPAPEARQDDGRAALSGDRPKEDR